MGDGAGARARDLAASLGPGWQPHARKREWLPGNMTHVVAAKRGRWAVFFQPGAVADGIPGEKFLAVADEKYAKPGETPEAAIAACRVEIRHACADLFWLAIENT